MFRAAFISALSICFLTDYGKSGGLFRVRNDPTTYAYVTVNITA